jgi:energy-coupling factor transport system ATP-binding protein
MIELEHVHFAYPDQGPSVRDVSFRLEKGEFVAILGANGAGKTTTVRLMDGLLRPTSGRVLVAGVDTKESQVSERARRVGFLFQNPDRQICKNTVREEILFGLRTVRGEEGEDALQARGRTLLPEQGTAPAGCPGFHPGGGTGSADPGRTDHRPGLSGMLPYHGSDPAHE